MIPTSSANVNPSDNLDVASEIPCFDNYHQKSNIMRRLHSNKSNAAYALL